MTVAVQARGVYKSFGRNDVLTGVDLFLYLLT